MQLLSKKNKTAKCAHKIKGNYIDGLAKLYIYMGIYMYVSMFVQRACDPARVTVQKVKALVASVSPIQPASQPAI